MDLLMNFSLHDLRKISFKWFTIKMIMFIALRIQYYKKENVNTLLRLIQQYTYIILK